MVKLYSKLNFRHCGGLSNTELGTCSWLRCLCAIQIGIIMVAPYYNSLAGDKNMLVVMGGRERMTGKCEEFTD